VVDGCASAAAPAVVDVEISVDVVVVVGVGSVVEFVKLADDVGASGLVSVGDVVSALTDVSATDFDGVDVIGAGTNTVTVTTTLFGG
jgi:hypothetical protein